MAETLKLHERVREVVEDPTACGIPGAERHRQEFLTGQVGLREFAAGLLSSLGYEDADRLAEDEDLEDLVYLATREFAVASDSAREETSARLVVEPARVEGEVFHRSFFTCDHCHEAIREPAEGHVSHIAFTPKGTYFTHYGCYEGLVGVIFGSDLAASQYSTMMASQPDGFVATTWGFNQALPAYLMDMAQGVPHTGRT